MARTSRAAAKTEGQKAAWNAIIRFREMQSQLTQFARTITGNSSVVVLLTEDTPHTIGNKIYLRPPLALGRDIEHIRNKCGMRGYDGRQECLACRAREIVNFFLFHEIAHIHFGSQDEKNRDDYEVFKSFVTEWHPVGACNHSIDLWKHFNNHTQVMPLTHAMSEFMPMLFNFLEDSRVNEGMFGVRAGLREVFDVNIERIMNEGVETQTGHVTWMGAPTNSQFLAGIGMKASGYNSDSWFHPSVVEALKDERLTVLLDQVAQAKDVHAIFSLTLKVFHVAQDLGFCLVPKCVIPEAVEPDDSGSDDETGEPGDSGDEPGSGGDGESPERTDSPSPDSSGSGSGGSASSDRDEEQHSDSSSDDDDSADGERASAGGGSESSPSGEVSPGSRSDGGAAGGGHSQPESKSPEASKEDSESGAGEPPVSGDPEVNDRASDAAEEASGGGQHDEEDVQESGESDRGSVDSDGDSSTEDVHDDDALESGEPAVPGAEGDLGDATSPESVEDVDSGRSERGVVEDESLQSEPRSGDSVDGTEEEDSHGPQDNEEESAPEDPWDDVIPELPESGTADEAKGHVTVLLMHGNDEDDTDGFLEAMGGEELVGLLEDVLGEHDSGTPMAMLVKQVVKSAIMQSSHFDDMSANVSGVEEITYPNAAANWDGTLAWKNFQADESILGPAVLKARRAFDDNRRTKISKNKTSGHIQPSKLFRAGTGDDRVFGKKTIPKRKSFLVVITGDCSGSTSYGSRNAKIKRLMMAQGEVLHRLGIPFVMLGHSADFGRTDSSRQRSYDEDDEYYVYMLQIKQEHEPWNDATKTRLANMSPVSENLDGHTLEYIRKIADKSQATDVVIIYYTDGQMPAANGPEEKVILKREVALCKKKGYHLLAVGVNTDSPEKYGMKTVRVERDSDITAVVAQIEKEITETLK